MLVDTTFLLGRLNLTHGGVTPYIGLIGALAIYIRAKIGNLVYFRGFQRKIKVFLEF